MKICFNVDDILCGRQQYLSRFSAFIVAQLAWEKRFISVIIVAGDNMCRLIWQSPRRWRSGLERWLRERKVGWWIPATKTQFVKTGRDSSTANRSEMTIIIDDPCHSRCGTWKNSNCSMTIGFNICSPCLATMTSLNEWKILKWDEKLQANKQTNQMTVYADVLINFI